MCVRCDKARVIDSRVRKAIDYKGDEVELVDYTFYEEVPIEAPVGVVVTEISYEKTLPSGAKEIKIYTSKTFHQRGRNWHVVHYRTEHKEVFDQEMKDVK
jgi:hypothetical protein